MIFNSFNISKAISDLGADSFGQDVYEFLQIRQKEIESQFNQLVEEAKQIRLNIARYYACKEMEIEMAEPERLEFDKLRDILERMKPLQYELAKIEKFLLKIRQNGRAYLDQIKIT